MLEERRREILAQVFREQNNQECDGALFGENHKALVAMRRAEDEIVATRNKLRAPHNLQACYDLGYANPSRPSRELEWPHLTNVNAYAAGQADAQNQAPRNSAYDRDQYDPETFERIVQSVTHE